MIEITLGGRLLNGQDHSKPASVRTGYRGVTAGSREGGSTSFELFFREGYQDGMLWFGTGAEVIIRKGIVVRFRGIVASLELPKLFGLTVRVDCVEDNSRLTDIRGGMARLGGLWNPDNYCWTTDREGPLTNSDPDDDARPIQWTIARIGRAFGTEYQASLEGYQKRELFDSWGWKNYHNRYGDFALRTVCQYEQSLDTLVERLIRVVRQDGSGPQIIGQDIDTRSMHKRPQVSFPLTGEDDLRFLPEVDKETIINNTNPYRMWGLFTRNLSPQAERASNAATFVWRETTFADSDGTRSAVELNQVLSHGLIRKMGIVPMRSHYWSRGEFGLDYDPLHSYGNVARFGPFPVLDLFGNMQDQQKLAWFWVWGYSEYNSEEDKTYYIRRATVYEVDLMQTRDNRGEWLAYRRIELEAFGIDPEGTPDYVQYEGGNYSLGPTVQPLESFRSARLGGEYVMSGSEQSPGPIIWRGDLYLSEIACEFEGSSVADILHNLGLATGCEWWLDGFGTLIFRRPDRANGTTTIISKRMIDDYETVRLRVQDRADDISGIPMSDSYGLLIKEENTRSMLLETAHRRTIEVEPDHYSIEVGTELILDGQSCGKIVSTVLEDPVVVIECEPA